MGHLTSVAFPTLGNLTKNLGPRVGTFAFFVQRNGTKSHRPISLSAAAMLEPRLAEDDVGLHKAPKELIKSMICKYAQLL